MVRTCLLVFVLPLAAFSAEKAVEPLPVVPSIDLQRYQGRWYEVARKPNPFQEACARDVLVRYGLRRDGRVDVYNECTEEDGDLRSVSGVARRPDPEGAPAKLEVRFAPAFLSFLPMVWGNYWVIDLDPNYGWAVVGEPQRKYLWVLSRSPSLPQATLDGILDRVGSLGYDVSDLIRSRQSGATP